MIVKFQQNLTIHEEFDFSKGERGPQFLISILLKKKYKQHKCHPKINLSSMFHPNQTMGNCSKLGGKLEMD